MNTSNRSSQVTRRTWYSDTKNNKYLPPIPHLDLRGAESLLNVLYQNSIEGHYDLKIHSNLYLKVFLDVLADPVKDFQTFEDLRVLMPLVFKGFLLLLLEVLLNPLLLDRKIIQPFIRPLKPFFKRRCSSVKTTEWASFDSIFDFSNWLNTVTFDKIQELDKITLCIS